MIIYFSLLSSLLSWSNELRSVHPDIIADVHYVQGRWIQIIEPSWPKLIVPINRLRKKVTRFVAVNGSDVDGLGFRANQQLRLLNSKFTTVELNYSALQSNRVADEPRECRAKMVELEKVYNRLDEGIDVLDDGVLASNFGADMANTVENM